MSQSHLERMDDDPVYRQHVEEDSPPAPPDWSDNPDNASWDSHGYNHALDFDTRYVWNHDRREWLTPREEALILAGDGLVELLSFAYERHPDLNSNSGSHALDAWEEASGAPVALVPSLDVVVIPRTDAEKEWSVIYPNGVRHHCSTEEQALRIASLSSGTAQWRIGWFDACLNPDTGKSAATEYALHVREKYDLLFGGSAPQDDADRLDYYAELENLCSEMEVVLVQAGVWPVAMRGER